MSGFPEMFQDIVSSLPADRIPNTVGAIDPLLGGDPEERFEFGRDLVVGGRESYAGSGSVEDRARKRQGAAQPLAPWPGGEGLADETFAFGPPVEVLDPYPHELEVWERHHRLSSSHRSLAIFLPRRVS